MLGIFMTSVNSPTLYIFDPISGYFLRDVVHKEIKIHGQGTLRERRPRVHELGTNPFKAPF